MVGRKIQSFLSQVTIFLLFLPQVTAFLPMMWRRFTASNYVDVKSTDISHISQKKCGNPSYYNRFNKDIWKITILKIINYLWLKMILKIALMRLVIFTKAVILYP